MIDSLKAANTGLRVLDATAQVAHLRGTKSPAELELLRTAARISAMAVIKAGLARLGLIESADAKIDGCTGGDSCCQYRLYYMHALSHPIGLDVHDVDQLSKTGHYGVGSAFTIEPGIYVRENVLDIIQIGRAHV